MKWILIVGFSLLSQACANQTELAKEALAEDLPSIGKFDSQTISYRNIIEYPGNVICGEYSTHKRARENSFNKFIYRSGELNRHSTQTDQLVFCSNNPKQGLCDSTGICFSSESNAALLQIQGDITMLKEAILEYRADNNTPPTSEQGIGALFRESKIQPRPSVFKKGGYIKEIPLDPWGNPYIYSAPVFAGVEGNFNIISLGKDGKAGGKNENADIELKHIKYLEHIQRLN